MHIQWYPGHMTKTLRMLKENLSLVDIIIEVLDARIPYSSKNPDISQLAGDKKRIALLNKSDLANEAVTNQWKDYYADSGYNVLTANSISGGGLNEVVSLSRRLMKEKIQRQKARGRIFVPIRAMIVGIPNSGKSTLINKLAGRQAAKTADKPGVTRGKQWIKVKKDFELLDTPGILWPKFDDPAVGLNLALTGAVNDNIMDRRNLAAELIKRVRVIAPAALTERYGVEPDANALPDSILEDIGRARGFLITGGGIDMERAAVVLIDEFREGRLGRISLERPADYNCRR